jgi:hypothetical protein
LSILLLPGAFSGCMSEGDDNGSAQRDGGGQPDAFDPNDFSIEGYQAYPRVDVSASAEPLKVLIACKLLDAD